MEIEERKPSAIWFQSTHTMKRKWNRGGALSRKIFPKLKLESDLEMDKSKDRSIRILVQQECIPVECVPSAAVAVCCGGCLPGGVVCPGGRRQPAGGGGCLPSLSRVVSAQGGFCLGVVRPGRCLSKGVSPQQGCLPILSGGVPPLWTKFLTHACENITFPQLRLRMVII